MRTDLFDFTLPEDRIALTPVQPRDAARLLVVRPGAPLRDRHVHQLTEELTPGDALVLNDTRVIMAELVGVRHRDDHLAKVSVTLHARVSEHRWRAFARPAKRLEPGDRIRFGTGTTSCLVGALDTTVEARDGPEVTLAFDLSGAALDEAIAAVGRVPLPPYIASKRPASDTDRTQYQTVYARHEGAVAAPTAGLHFTTELLQRLSAHGIARHFLTLHVGAGTFLPMTTEDTDHHTMHAEWGHVSAETASALNTVKAKGGRIVAVGTTTLRLLESAADDDGTIHPFAGETAIFITPGYRFRAVDVLMTNFHLPRSTLFMLVSAFAGLNTMQSAYAHAIENGYRFYSYGDASLLYRQD